MAFSRVSALWCIAAVAVALATAASAQVQSESVKRENVAPGEATPLGASFSVQLPVPYADVDVIAGEDHTLIRMVTGTSSDHVKFSASEVEIQPDQKLHPLEDFMNSMKEKSGAALSDVERDKMGTADTLSFALIDASGGGNYVYVVRTKAAQYVMVLQFPAAQREAAASMREPFFGSFKLDEK